LTGAGFGQSIQKLHYLPEAHNDFIFAIIGEEFGLIGAGIFLLVYVAFIWRIISISLRAPDTFGMLVGIGIAVMLAVQSLINMGGVTNAIPMTGVTLPLISSGGSSLLMTLASMGIVLSVSRELNRNH
jgi:cell division protein FtsW